MREIEEPIKIVHLDTFDVVDGNGRTGELYTGFANPAGTAIIKEMAKEMGAGCQIGESLTEDEVSEILESRENPDINGGRGKSFSLSHIKGKLPFLSGSAWNKNRPKDPTQN